jgi:hypothetical protein
MPTIVEDLRDGRGTIREAALVHFCNDSTDYFTNTLRCAIEQSGILDLRDRTLSEKVRTMLNLRHPSYASVDKALQSGEDLGRGGALCGLVYEFESYRGGAKIDVEVNLADVATGRNVFSKRYQVESSGGSALVATVQERTRGFPWFQRLLGWLLAVLLLPVFTINFMRAMVRKESNRANAFVLGIYTLADALLAWLLVGADLHSWWKITVFFLAVAGAVAYNVRIMTFAVHLEAQGDEQ